MSGFHIEGMFISDSDQISFLLAEQITGGIIKTSELFFTFDTKYCFLLFQSGSLNMSSDNNGVINGPCRPSKDGALLLEGKIYPDKVELS